MSEPKTEFYDKAESLSQGNVVEYEYRSEKTGEPVTGEGVVAKSNRGGIRILKMSGRSLLVVKFGGNVTRTHPDGGALRRSPRVGEDATVEATGENKEIEYEQRGGWQLADN